MARAMVESSPRLARVLQQDWRGLFNAVVLDSDSETVSVASDHLGALPLYYRSTPELLVLSNSLSLLHEALAVEPSRGAFGLSFLLTYLPGDRCALDGFRRVRAGSVHVFHFDGSPPEVGRYSDAWSRCDRLPARELAAEVVGLLQETVPHHLGGAGSRIGLMLSGGLDSRLVGGLLLREGAELTCCTHGNPASVEWNVATEVARRLGAPLLENALDDDFRLGDLRLEEQLARTDRIFNPIWMRSADLLADRGVEGLATGCMFDALLGGSLLKVGSPEERFWRSALSALGQRPFRDLDPGEAAADQVVTSLKAQAEKRLRNFEPLLTEEYREVCHDATDHIEEIVRDELSGYDLESITALQAIERFEIENRVRKTVMIQELTLRGRGRLVLPTLDPSLLRRLSNVDPNERFAYRSYYRVLKELLPDLAAVEVPNLHTAADRPHLYIELKRALRRAGERFAAPRRAMSWVNFDSWILGGDRLAELRSSLLQLDDVFDAPGVDRLFDDVSERRRRLFDGNEMLGFLSAATWVTSRGDV